MDIYAFGVVAHQLLSGELPFPGPEVGDYREQHLHQEPPSLAESIPVDLRSLVLDCLAKAAGSRPSADNVSGRLQALGGAESTAIERLQKADLGVSRERAAQEARFSREQTAAEEKVVYVADAQASLVRVAKILIDTVQAAAPASVLSNKTGSLHWEVNLGAASLSMDGVHDVGDLSGLRFPASFDVVAYSTIIFRIPRDASGDEGRAHSLWYCDALEQGVFRWYETAFMISPFIAERFLMDPTALPPGEDSFGALSNVTTTRQVAWPFSPIESRR